jgi:hypothetical protein
LSQCLAEVELVGRECCREELEDRKRDTACVDLLEDLAHRLARGVAAELDHRQLVLIELGRQKPGNRRFAALRAQPGRTSFAPRLPLLGAL